SIVGGARYDDARASTNNVDLVFATNDTVLQHDKATTGRIGAIYEFDSGVAPYVVYATSFNPNIAVTGTGDPLKPTTGELYEGGVKFQPKGTKIFLQASYFDLTQQNVVTINPLVPNVRSQIGEVHSRGFEFEGKMSVTDNLDVVASYTHVDPVITK